MLKTKKAETFAGIIIGVFILSIILLGLGKLMYYSYDMLSQFNDANRINILQNNLTHIIRKLDTTEVLENEVFYVHKNKLTKDFEVFTGATNVEYKYIDKYGDKVDSIDTYEWTIYSRVLWKERSDNSIESDAEVIRVYIKKLIKK